MEQPPTLMIFNAADFEKLSELGTGNGGTVYKVLHRPSNRIMARKLFHEEIMPRNQTQMLNELRILMDCQSPFIVAFYGITYERRFLTILMEYMDAGSTDQLTAACVVNGEQTPPTLMPENVLSEVTISVISAMHYLDQKKILHRDIKPSNILMNTQGEIKLCDFSVSRLLVGSAASTFIGTRCYMAAERIKGERYKIASDIWSLGLSLMQLAIGRYPVPSPTVEEFAAIFSGSLAADRRVRLSFIESVNYICLNPPPSFPHGVVSDSFKDLTDRCLNRDASVRPTLDDLFNHPFIAQRQSGPINVANWIAEIQARRLPHVQG